MDARLILLTLLSFFGNSMAEDKSEMYQNPVDGKTYVAPGGWKSYQPTQGISPQENKKVIVAGIRLLSAQNDFEERSSVVELAAYLNVKRTKCLTALPAGNPLFSYVFALSNRR